MDDWSGCKNILCVRLDNMGDLLMSGPALKALKETFRCKITVLTSTMAKNMARLMPCIDEVITYDVPWVKSDLADHGESFFNVVNHLRGKRFDGAVIFTVFSQNPTPAIMLTWLADIPKRLAYCRENPYALLTTWIPDREPYTFIQHQVKRDLALVQHIGADIADDRLAIALPDTQWRSVQQKLSKAGINMEKPWLIIHPGVSEEKRKYPVELWIATGKKIVKTLKHQVVITGSAAELPLAETIATGIDKHAFACAGLLTPEEFVMAIDQTPLVISVNTATIHIAAATNTKLVVLYALTNPQHTPWKATGKVLPFSVPEHMQSKNEVIQFVQQAYFNTFVPPPAPGDIVEAAHALLTDANVSMVPELVGLPGAPVSTAVLRG